jgi:hypothetical protein
MDHVDEWAAALRASDRSGDTVRAYTEAVRSCAAHAGKPPLELTPGDVSAWLGRPGLSKNTRAAYYRRLRACLGRSPSVMVSDAITRSAAMVLLAATI